MTRRFELINCQSQFRLHTVSVADSVGLGNRSSDMWNHKCTTEIFPRKCIVCYDWQTEFINSHWYAHGY